MGSSWRRRSWSGPPSSARRASVSSGKTRACSVDLRADIVVIGGGLSGATAALRAASLGREVVLVRKGYGATAIGSGTFDVLGGSPCENLGLLTGERFDSAHELLSLAKRLPLHPYGLLADVHGGHAEEAGCTFQPRFEAASSFLLAPLA